MAGESARLLLTPKKLTAEETERLAKAEIVFTATLAEATEVGMTKSLPPVRLHVLQFTNVKASCGTVPEKLRANYSLRSMGPVSFSGNGECTVAGRMVGDEFFIEVLTPAPQPNPDMEDPLRKQIEELLRERQREKPAVPR